MYAGTTTNWHEVTKTKISTNTADTSPLFMAVFSCDKGPEQLTNLAASEFFNLYGNTADFFKYGQPLTQSHTILNAGGRILGYRLVADDATLANAIVTATVTEKEENKTNANGQPLYIDAEGNETTEVTETRATVTSAVVKYGITTISNAKTFDAVAAAAEALATATTFPLLIITDNGRGKSVKKFRITPDYSVSKSLTYCVYSINDIESNAVLESVKFAMYPNALYAKGTTLRSMNLIENSTTQFRTSMIDAQIGKYVEALSAITGYSVEELYKNDFIFGTTLRGVALPTISLDETGVNLNNSYGISLESGTNGAFGDAPFPGSGTPVAAWTAKAKAFFSGDVTDEIYDRDLHKLDFIPDANYPDDVKAPIATFSAWRKDAWYLRDLGVDIWSYDDVVAKVSTDKWIKTPFGGDYLTTYEIIDPTSKKQVRVTSIHGIAPLLVNYYNTNPAAPLAGEFNGFVITEAIEGTLNFAPRITPKVNQKELLDELHVNYANLSTPTNLVLQSTFTSQDHAGPLLFANNVIITQMAIKAIRKYTPKIRWQLMETSDFSKYKQLIEDNVLSGFTKYFKSIELIYTKDDDMSANKIFNASIECYYKDFAQSEIFDVYAIDGDPDSDSSQYTMNVIDIE